MFLPISDTPRPLGTPVMTYALIAANVLLYVLCLPLMQQAPNLQDPQLLAYVQWLQQDSGLSSEALLAHVSAYDVVLFTYGFRPDAPSISTLLSSMFLHASMLHLAGNMLFLYIFGDNVEMRCSRLGYLGIYMLSGVAATAFFSLLRWGTSTPLMGASGAISGILGCYFVWFPKHRVKVLMTMVFFWDVLHIPARWVLAFYILIENLLPALLRSNAAAGVAYGAHIGGFFAGAGMAWVIRQAELQTSPATLLVPPREPPLHALLQQRKFVEAAAIYHALSHAQALQVLPEDVLSLGDWLTEQQRYAEALSLFQRFIATRRALLGSAAGAGQLALAHLRAGFIQMRALNRPEAAYQHFSTALALTTHWQVAAAARQALSQLAKPPA